MRSRDEIKGFLKDIQKQNLGMVERAKAFAEFAHAGQVDKGGQAYIYHPTRVAELTAEKYHDDILTAAAYMHDVVEDGGFTVSDLSLFFPVAVWKTVELLTRGKSDGRDVYIGRIGENLLATKVKLMDLKDNMVLGTGQQVNKDGREADSGRNGVRNLRRSLYVDFVMCGKRERADCSALFLCFFLFWSFFTALIRGWSFFGWCFFAASFWGTAFIVL